MLKIKQVPYDPDCVVSILENYEKLVENEPKTRKNSKEWKKWDEDCENMRIKYNKTVGFEAFILKIKIKYGK